jgi:pyrroline-5-carboxylate reductase
MSSLSRAAPTSLVLFGAGKMGAAMLEGWLAVGMNTAAATILDPQPSADVEALCGKKQIPLNPPLRDLMPPKVVVLAIKPQMLEAAAAVINRLVKPDTLVVSILAGKTLADLKRQMPGARAVVRAMPNLAASVRRSATAAVASAETSAAQKQMAHELLSSIGAVAWLADEELMDAVTAVSGSGPAYFFYLAECLAHAGTVAGLPQELSAQLARATLVGAGELLAQTELPPGKLRHDVTSPGGTTAAALDVLMAKPGLSDLLQRAVQAAKLRAGELSG